MKHGLVFEQEPLEWDVGVTDGFSFASYLVSFETVAMHANFNRYWSAASSSQGLDSLSVSLFLLTPCCGQNFTLAPDTPHDRDIRGERLMCEGCTQPFSDCLATNGSLDWMEIRGEEEILSEWDSQPLLQAWAEFYGLGPLESVLWASNFSDALKLNSAAVESIVGPLLKTKAPQ